MNNAQILEELSRYLPEGCIAQGDHVPVEGKGSWYVDADGKRYLDLTSGIFTNTLGHAPDCLEAARQKQTQALSNVHGRHTQAELLFYKRLFQRLPAQDYKAIAYNDGGYAIDRALSDLINHFGKKPIAIAAFRGNFHGKTQACKLLINETENAALFENHQLPFPDCRHCPWGKTASTCASDCVPATRKALRDRRIKVLIFEVVQGAQVKTAPRGFWKQIADFCKEEGIVLFADEVLTGGGRTGRYLACEHEGIVPDVIALTKGLANGQPLSVILERTYLTENPYARRPMERSSTFAAHPEALAVAAEVLQQLEQQRILPRVETLGRWLLIRLDRLRRFPGVADVRGIGLMAAVEFADPHTGQPDSGLCRRVYERCREEGVQLIYSGHCLRLAPPLNITKEELSLGLALLEEAIDTCTKGGAQ